MKISSVNTQDGSIRVGNLIIIVGSNGVGKTTFLRDLYNEFIAKRPNGTTESNHSLSSAKWTDLFNGDDGSTISEWRSWLDRVVVVTGEQVNNLPVYALPRSLGRESKPRKINESDRLAAVNYSNSPNATVDGLSNGWCSIFRDQHTAFLSVDNRFYVSNNFSGQLSPDTLANIQPAPFLAVNDDVARRISKEVLDLFKKKIFIESPQFPSYHILVGDSDVKAPARLRMTSTVLMRQKKSYDSWVTNNSVITLNEEGHGVRAAFEILYSLKIEENKLIFIDEPEIHLYPSIKYEIGKIIGEYTKRSRKQIVLTTHDTELLRGLLASNAPATILKIKRDRSIVSVQRGKIRGTIASDVLQTAFLDAVIVTEGVTDQYVYRRVFEQRKLLRLNNRQYAYEVVAVNGKESVADDFTYYTALGVGFVGIYDYDAIFYNSKRKIAPVLDGIKKSGASAGDYKNIESQIRNIESLTRGKPFRKFGVRGKGLGRGIIQKIERLVSDCEKFGVFIVPGGGLESWVGVDGHLPPELIYSKYRSSANSKYKSLTEFAERINQYLESKIV